MRKFILPIIIAASGLFSQAASAQVSISFRIGTPAVNVYRPVPQPAVVYDDFYYLPEVEAYYSVPEHCYYYMDGGRRWVSAAYLPGSYHDYDWRYARRYQVRSVRPYEQHNVYRNRYGSNWRGDWNDSRYYAGRDRYQDRRDGSRNIDRRTPYDSNNTWGRNNDRGQQQQNDRDRGRSYNNDRRQNTEGNGWSRGNDRSRGEQRSNDGRNDRLQMAGVQRVSF